MPREVSNDGRVEAIAVAGLLTFGTEPTEFLASGSIEAPRYVLNA